ALPPFVEPVGVFVERSWPEIRQVLASLDRLRYVQRHGEPPTGLPADAWRFVPVFAVEHAACLDRIAQYLDQCAGLGRLPDAILVDGHVPGQHGGTGRQAPWNLLADFRPTVPMVLAGGLTPDNVA